LNTIHNIAISASAGSGKTYQLTNRFIYLLHLAEQPQRIIALTFTRTAAGEFFQKIIDKLCDAAEDPKKAANLSKELSITADSARYHQLLQLLIRSMHRLNLQTLDSFFFRVVSAFSLELGLSGSLNLLDESSEPRVRNEVRDSIVHNPGELTAELNEFWHAFKQATYGQEKRSIEKVVSDFIEQLYALFLEAPQAQLWGKADTIWPNGCPWKSSNTPDWEQLADNIITALPEDLSKSQQKDFETLALKIRLYPVEEKTNALLERALAQASDILEGNCTLQCGRGKNNQVQLSGSACDALADCLRTIVWHHLKRAMENTQGVHRILQAYHENYDRLVRRPGRLAFADLTHLLAPESEGSPMGKLDEMTRQLMEFRLDGQYDHWLFDEFQDTSRPQWEVVANLIDEIVQDDSGQRSFFYVGDTKQCLYLWRNSDDRLFHDIQQAYQKIQTVPLSVSWRSAQPVLDAVNTVFSDNAAIAESFSADAAQRWGRAWQSHSASPATKNLSGYACWLKAEKDDAPDRNALILQILKDLNPIQRGMTVGVLVRKNDDANEVADFLRENSRFPVHTGSAIQPAVDNAAGAALLAMLRLAGHPGDTHAHGFLQIIDCSSNGTSLVAAAPKLRSYLLAESNEYAVRWAASQIITHLIDDDTRHRERLEQLVAKARDFDREERRDIDGLYDFLYNSRSGECPAGDAIIIETVHKSKGLEYDVVILVNEDKSIRHERRISPLLDAQGKAEWILEPIKKELMQADPVLDQFLQQSESQRGFGNLCTLYVAMTRAKRGLYMISDFERVSQNSTVGFLRDILGDSATPSQLFHDTSYPLIWSTGDANWHASFERNVIPKSTHESPLVAQNQFSPAHPRLQLAKPSASKSFKKRAAHAFEINQTAANFGSQMHAAFEQIEWLADDLASAPLNTSTANTDSIPAEVSEALSACFAAPEIRALFTKPTHATTVWRERAFSYIEGDQFHNGIFDRVVLHHSPKGDIERATIIDFKTDKMHADTSIANATEYHRPQLEAYRKALAKILALDMGKIELMLLFSDVHTCVRLNNNDTKSKKA